MRINVRYFVSEMAYLIGLFGMLMSSFMSAFIPFYASYICSIFMAMGILILPSKKIDKKYVRWVLLYLSFFIISSLWAINYKSALGVVIIYMIPIVIGCISTMYYLCSGGNIKKVLIVFIIASLILSAYVVAHMGEFVAGVRLGAGMDDMDEHGRTTFNGNSVAEMLCYSIFAGWVLFIGGKKHWLVSIIYVVLCIPLLFVILMSGSRQALLILVIPILYFAFIGSKHKFLWILLGTGFLVLGYYLIMNVEILYLTIGTRTEELIDILTGNDVGNEDTSRFELIEFGYNQFWEHPILGVGINNFRVLSNRAPAFSGMDFYAHNNYIELLVDVGIIGFILYYWGYIYLIKHLRKIKRIIHKKDKLYSWGVVLLFLRLFLDFAQVSYYNISRCLMLCICFYIVYKKEHELYCLKHCKKSFKNEKS